MSDARTAGDSDDHRAFLNGYYRWARHVYDASRKYYLLGRDEAIRMLLQDPWDRLVEIGPGTGRNLRKLREGRPQARFGGVEASDAMLEFAADKYPWAELVHGFAETADYRDLLGDRPDIVLFSYCLSMVQDPHAALENARRTVGPGGRVVVVDFGDLKGLQGWARKGLRGWLEAFHVEPLDLDIVKPYQPILTYGPGRYYLIAEIEGVAEDAPRAVAAE